MRRLRASRQSLTLFSADKGTQAAMSADKFGIHGICFAIDVDNHSATVQHFQQLGLGGGKIVDPHFGQQLLVPAETHAGITHSSSSRWVPALYGRFRANYRSRCAAL